MYMKRKRHLRWRTLFAVLLTVAMGLQGTEPLMVWAATEIRNQPRTVSFVQPKALTDTNGLIQPEEEAPLVSETEKQALIDANTATSHGSEEGAFPAEGEGGESKGQPEGQVPETSGEDAGTKNSQESAVPETSKE
jgi:hypothetical protein